MTVTLPDSAAAWLASGARGLSSEALFTLTIGLDIRGDAWRPGYQHPLDPDDFQRCERMLRAVPEARERLHTAKVTHEWAALIDHWGEIVALMEEEVPGVFEGDRKYGRAPKAYALMKRLEDEARGRHFPSEESGAGD